MGHNKGQVTEIRHDAGRHTEAFIACATGLIPLAGQYLWASDLDDPAAVLGVPLFAAERSRSGFWAASPIPNTWIPGANLDLVGPLGHGFDLPREMLRLGLVAMGETVSRLLPLVKQIAGSHVAMTLFSDLPLPALPALLEAYPLTSLAEALEWPDFMVFDLPLARLPELRHVVGLPEGTGLPCPAQVLVITPIPCAQLADCGACAVPARRGWKLACKDGPVFALNQLKW